MNDSMASSQDDHLTEHGYGPAMGEDGAWNQAGAMGVKTSRRTYTTPNGTIITEVCNHRGTYCMWMRKNYQSSLNICTHTPLIHILV